MAQIPSGDSMACKRNVRDGARQSGWHIDHVGDANAARSALVDHAQAAVLLDIALPGDSGLAVLRTMRTRYDATPVRLAAEWVDDKYVDYYYGVRPSEVTATRTFYEGRSTTNIHAGLRVDYTPAQHHTLFLDLGASRFGSTVKDSPLIVKPNQSSIGLGYIYRF